MRHLIWEIWVVGMMLAVGVGSAKGQAVGGYVYETGIDGTLWVDMSDAQPYTDHTQMIDLGFDFFFCGAYYQTLSVDRWCRVFLDWFNGSNYESDWPPVMAPFGARQQAEWIKWKVTGSEGDRVCVIAMGIDVNGTAVRPVQVHISERDGSILYLYGAKGNSYQFTQFWIGFKGEDGTVVSVDRHNTASSSLVYWTTGFTDWPGENRYYRFTPGETARCGFPRGVTVMGTTDVQATVRWRRFFSDIGYEFAYRPANTNEAWTTVFCLDTSIVLSNLTPWTNYEFSVRSICGDNSASKLVYGSFSTLCHGEILNQIDFANLRGTNVTCLVGTYEYPSSMIRIWDMGPESEQSRHTVHTDTSERDPRTRLQLRTIPEGHCRSVRLGNWRTGAEQESITYTLTVDSNLYDMLLLRYAIVEENPSHEVEYQPKFLLSVRYLSGRLVDSCYYANFVAGQGDTAWQGGVNALVVWRDWTTVGIDLAPLHGQTINVVLENYDCQQGAHYGYAYFTLESGFKRLQSSYCGNTDTNIFFAPKGFSYRWYNASNPNETLGRSDSLMVVGSGEYKCRISFTTGDSSCGVTLTTHAGTRFPVASFTIVPKDSCGYSFKFMNNSVVARDEAHTQLINEPCEQYLWRFGDGTESNAVNPERTFETGTYNVELVAMLANGQCRDSVSQTITINRLEDTIADTFCIGGTYRFYNSAFTRPGFYTVTDGCWRHSVSLSQYQYFYEELEDTICDGDTYVVGDKIFNAAGEYDARLKSVEGCDSTYHLSLVVRQLPVGNYEIGHTCHGASYYYLTGKYRMADSSYTETGSVAFVGEDGLVYRWSGLTPLSTLPSLTESGEVHFISTRHTAYCVQYQYMDYPACPVVDTIELESLDEIVADLEVSPTWLGYDKYDLTALDRSRHAAGRQWFVDGVMQDEEGPILYYSISPEADSVVVAVVAYNATCTDTAEKVVPVLRHMLSFPNVFTPSLSTNNCFGGIGSNITEYELWVFDRRGCLVFHSTDMEDTWDGTCNGIPCKQEAYAYTCSYTTPTNDRLTVTGIVTLLR